MAKGYDTHQQRQNILASFGKDLARRAKSQCELTGVSGVPLIIYEVPPTPSEPEFDKCIFISQSAAQQIEQPKNLIPDDWRSLRELIWSDQENIQVMAFRILSFIAKSEEWARLVLEEAQLEEEVIAIAKAHPIT